MSGSRSVVSSAKLIAVCTLLSRVTGLIRDILIAQAFGLGWVQDAFNYAFQLPNLFRRLFGEGAMAPVFVPVFTQTLERDGREAAWRMLARTIALMSVAIAVVIALVALIIVAVWLAAPVDPSRREARELLLKLTLIMLPFMWSICILALLSSVLNCVGSFVPAALAPIVLNAAMIVVLGWLAPRLYPGDLVSQVALASWSVVAAGVIQLVLVYPALRRRQVGLGFRLDWGDPAVRRMMTLLGPVALGQGVLAFGVFLDAQVCTLLTHVHGTPETANWFGLAFRYPLEEGALSAITCAQRLYQFPLGVLVISLATAALPAFSRHAANQRWTQWGADVRQTFRLSVFEGLLAGAMMVVLATPIVRLLFERGQFDAADTHRAAHVLSCYGFGLWAFCAQHIVSRAFYSLGDVRTPLALSAAALPLNVLLNVVLVWFEPIGEAAFAISSVITQSLTVVAGIALLERRLAIRVFTRDVIMALARMLAAAFVTGALVAAIIPWWGDVTAGLPTALLRRSAETLPPLLVGSLLFLLVGRAIGLSEPRLLIPRRFRQGAA
jgi:putative peptidoglycan lipid II flippase